MGLIRSVLVTLLSILLFLTLFSMNTFLTMSMSLDYDVLEPELTDTVTEIITGYANLSYLDEVLPKASVVCDYVDEIPLSGISSIQNVDLEDPLVLQNLTEILNNQSNETSAGDDEGITEGIGSEFSNMTVSCEVISQGSEAIIADLVSQKVEEQYYKEYDCDFWDCTSTNEIPFYLVSQKAQNYWQGWFYLSLMASLALAVILFVISENRSNWPFLIGALMIISAIPFLAMGWFLTLVSGWEYARIFSLFFTQSFATFLFGFVAGILLIGIGVVLKFLNFGKKISGWFKIGKSKGNDEKEKSEPEKTEKSKKPEKSGK